MSPRLSDPGNGGDWERWRGSARERERGAEPARETTCRSHGSAHRERSPPHRFRALVSSSPSSRQAEEHQLHVRHLRVFDKATGAQLPLSFVGASDAVAAGKTPASRPASAIDDDDATMTHSAPAPPGGGGGGGGAKGKDKGGKGKDVALAKHWMEFVLPPGARVGAVRLSNRSDRLSSRLVSSFVQVFDGKKELRRWKITEDLKEYEFCI